MAIRPTNSGFAMDTNDIATNSHPTSETTRRRALTSRQERRLVAYLDDRILECTRNFKKRNEETSGLRTLLQYLEEVQHILALVLQIPPVDPSTGLRTYYLLRLTGDILSSIPGYRIDHPATTTNAPLSSQLDTSKPAPVDLHAVRDILQDLVDFLDDLDQAWLAVLKGQVWDPDVAEGVDLEGGLSHITDHADEEGMAQAVPVEAKATLPNQTDTTRLRSLLVGGESALEEWLLDQKLGGKKGGGNFNLAGILQSMGLLEDFDNLFVRTLGHLGEFKGENIPDENMEMGEGISMSAPFDNKIEGPEE